jgi:four helix bundle protein
MPDGNEVKDGEEVKEKTARRGPVRRGPVRIYSDLLVYQQGYRLALQVSKLTRSFPRAEQYELGRQIRRSSRSIPANIVEGWTKRNSAAEFKRHLMITSGETAETKFWLQLAVDEGFSPKIDCDKLSVEYSKLE